jgi:hypothetical protein
VENNKRSRRTRHANTIKFQQRHAFWISLRPKAASKAISKGEDRDTKKGKNSAIAASEAARKA